MSQKLIAGKPTIFFWHIHTMDMSKN